MMAYHPKGHRGFDESGGGIKTQGDLRDTGGKRGRPKDIPRAAKGI